MFKPNYNDIWGQVVQAQDKKTYFLYSPLGKLDGAPGPG